MRSKRRKPRRWLGVIIGIEFLALIIATGFYYFGSEWFSKAGGDDHETAGNEKNPQLPVFLAEFDAAISTDLIPSNSWLSKSWIRKEIVEILENAPNIQLIKVLSDDEQKPISYYKLGISVIIDDHPAEMINPDPSAPEILLKLMTTVRISPVPAQEPGEKYGAQASADAPWTVEPGQKSIRPEVVRQLVREGLEQALIQVFAEATMGQQTVDQLLETARTHHPQRKVAALRALASRKDGRALDALLAALQEEHQDVVLAAVGALAERRDPVAVGRLIDSTRDRNFEYLSQVLFVVSSIGGAEAEAYLDTLAMGHEDREIRERAQEALEELRARKVRAQGQQPASNAAAAAPEP